MVGLHERTQGESEVFGRFAGHTVDQAAGKIWILRVAL